MVLVKSIGVALMAAQATATLRATTPRRLSLQDIAGYQPGSQVTDHVSSNIGDNVLSTKTSCVRHDFIYVLRCMRIDSHTSQFLFLECIRTQAAIDLDQAAFESQLALQTEESFDFAKEIYLQGGHSKSYAEVTLSKPLVGNIGKGSEIQGMNEKGKQVVGKAYDDYASGSTNIKVQYKTTDDQVSCLLHWK